MSLRFEYRAVVFVLLAVGLWVAPAGAAATAGTAPKASRSSATAHSAASSAGSRAATGPVADSLRAAIEKDRAETLERLKSAPTSYLATVQRRDFGDKTTLTVGRARDNDVRIDDSEIRGHHLRVTVVGDSFHVRAVDPEASFKAASDAVLRQATLAPSVVQIGRFGVRLSHQRYPALIVFDPQSPRFKEYKGLEWYPIDLSYRFVLPLTPRARPDTVFIMSTRGNLRRAARVGWFEFSVGGTQCRLEATRLLEPGVGENDFGLFFRDATTGTETYGVGRYLDVQRRPDGRYVLDFNMAYNPACAVSEHYNCPIPLKSNRLAVAIRAGEKDSHYLEH